MGPYKLLMEILMQEELNKVQEYIRLLCTIFVGMCGIGIIVYAVPYLDTSWIQVVAIFGLGIGILLALTCLNYLIITIAACIITQLDKKAKKEIEKLAVTEVRPYVSLDALAMKGRGYKK